MSAARTVRTAAPKAVRQGLSERLLETMWEDRLRLPQEGPNLLSAQAEEPGRQLPSSTKPCGKTRGSGQGKDVYPGCYTNTEESPRLLARKNPFLPDRQSRALLPLAARQEGVQRAESAPHRISGRACRAIDTRLVRYLEQAGRQTEEQEERELEVVAEESSTGKPVAMQFGLDLSPLSLFLFNTTCADVKMAPGQVDLSWQVEFGPCVWQVRYGKTGCWIETMPAECED